MVLKTYDTGFLGFLRKCLVWVCQGVFAFGFPLQYCTFPHVCWWKPGAGRQSWDIINTDHRSLESTRCFPICCLVRLLSPLSILCGQWDRWLDVLRHGAWGSRDSVTCPGLHSVWVELASFLPWLPGSKVVGKSSMFSASWTEAKVFRESVVSITICIHAQYKLVSGPFPPIPLGFRV